ncbi:MAG: carbohydrate porin [Pseudomonadota bacterium]
MVGEVQHYTCHREPLRLMKMPGKMFQWLAMAVISVCLIGDLAGSAIAQTFVGPDTVERQLETDSEQTGALETPDLLGRWDAYKKALAEETGLTFSVDYTSLAFAATESTGDDFAASGMVRFLGAWELFTQDTGDSGAIVLKGEHRHAYTTVAPSALGFDIGYVGILNGPFSDQGPRLTNLYWRQRLGSSRATINAGLLDVTDYVDAYALGSPWTHFSNLAFSTGSGTIGAPNEATLGVAGGVFITDTFYAIAGIADANADPTEPFHSFGTFFDEKDYFTSLEIGWTSARDRLIFDNVHATIWHTDGSDEFGVNSGWGVAGSATWYVNDQWLPFLRGGFASDGGALLEASISAGFGWQPSPGPGQDLLGFGINWGRPNSNAFGPGLGDQWTGEIFYRLNVTDNLAVTPDIQLIVNPALDPNKNAVGIFGLRVRLAV